MGIARNTVRKFLRDGFDGELKQRKPRTAPASDAIAERASDLLDIWSKQTTAKQRITASRLHAELRDEGHEVGVTTVRHVVREWRREQAESFLPLTYRPGELAQVDFLEVVVEVGGGAACRCQRPPPCRALDVDEHEVEPGIAACVQLGVATVSRQTASPRCAAKLNVHAFGMNLHTATTALGRDRKQLERLSRYLPPPPFATDAIQRLSDGRVRLDIARRGRSVTMSAKQFIAKLIALVPPPSVPMVRCAGIFSSRHHLRAAIAPAPARCPEQSEPEQTRLLPLGGRPVDTKNPGPVTPSKLARAQLLARVFGVDVLSCTRPGCGGKLKATAAVLHSREIALLLYGARGPPKPSPPGQLSFLNFEA